MTTLAEQIEEATNDNMHTEALMIKARAMNNEEGAAFLVMLQMIDDEHELAGELSNVNNQLRYAIDVKMREWDEYLGLK